MVIRVIEYNYHSLENPTSNSDGSVEYYCDEVIRELDFEEDKREFN